MWYILIMLIQSNKNRIYDGAFYQGSSCRKKRWGSLSSRVNFLKRLHSLYTCISIADAENQTSCVTIKQVWRSLSLLYHVYQRKTFFCNTLSLKRIATFLKLRLVRRRVYTNVYGVICRFLMTPGHMMSPGKIHEEKLRFFWDWVYKTWSTY